MSKRSVEKGIEQITLKGSDPTPFAHHPIVSALACAVPLWAHRLCETTPEHVFDKEALNKLAERLWVAGEAILFKVPGKSADGFNALAETIARLAFCPGGVRCYGMWFKYEIGKWVEGKHGVPDPASRFNASSSTSSYDASVAQELAQVGVKLKERVGRGSIPK